MTAILENLHNVIR